MELGCFKEAIMWFEKGWKDYWKEPVWISRYIYSLFKINYITRAEEIISQVIQQTNEQIRDILDEVCDEGWTENDKEECIQQLSNYKEDYEHMVEKVVSGYIPKMKFKTSIYTGCYLFGCQRHHHPEYQG